MGATIGPPPTDCEFCNKVKQAFGKENAADPLKELREETRRHPSAFIRFLREDGKRAQKLGRPTRLTDYVK